MSRIITETLYEKKMGLNVDVGINRLFAYCKGGNFNIHTGHDSAISSAKEGKSGFIYNLVKS